MIHVKQIDHVQLPVVIGGLRTARHFYQELLGLRELRDPALDRPGTLRFSLGGPRLDLTEGHYLGVAPQAHLALEVSGLPEVAQRLRDASVVFERAPLEDRERFYVEDPFGNRLELIAADERISH
jgi:catechol 2,3-dioxygenase-like lactoylglutathione lyase family enzyme